MADDYLKDRLACVREQLARIDARMLRCGNAQEMAWLASASQRLSDQEFALAGRPKPGNLKPRAGAARLRPMSGPIGAA